MLRRPVLTSGTVGVLVAAALVIYTLVGGSDTGFPYILVVAGMVAVGTFLAALLVLWLVEVLSHE